MLSFLLLAVSSLGESWGLPIVIAISLGAGILLGRLTTVRGSAGETPPSPGTPPSGATGKRAALPEVHDEKYWQEQRNSARYEVRPSHVMLAGAPNHPEAIEAVLLDRSLGGIGLWVEKQFPSGVVLYALLMVDEQPMWVPLEVRYCRLERGRWRLGCKFVEAKEPANA